MVDLFDACVGLRDEQRQRLTILVLAETHLPRKNRSANDEIPILILQAIKVPEAKLRPIFDDSQWRSLRHLFKRLKETMENEVAAEDADLQGLDDPAADPVERAAPDPAEDKKGNREDR